MTTKLIVEKEGSVLKLVLNRPEKLNCIDLDILKGIEETINWANDDDDIKLVMISGAGNKSFSTGGDLKRFKELQGKEVDHWISYGNKVFNTVESCKKAVLADIDGYAIGGGLELALACDFRICSSNSFFSMPEIYLGWLPGWGGLVRIKRLIGEARAKELILLGLPIDAKKAFNFGLVNEIYDTENQKAEILKKFTDQLIKVNPDVYSVAKSLLIENNRKTTEPDLYFDIQSVHYFKNLT